MAKAKLLEVQDVGVNRTPVGKDGDTRHLRNQRQGVATLMPTSRTHFA